jgi:putative oxidoreductase
MIVAYLTAERPDIHSMDDFVKATPFPFLFTVLVVLCFGPGRLSLDYLLERLVWKRKPKSPSAPPRGFPVE